MPKGTSEWLEACPAWSESAHHLMSVLFHSLEGVYKGKIGLKQVVNTDLQKNHLTCLHGSHGAFAVIVNLLYSLGY